jgi:hypothetical protein
VNDDLAAIKAAWTDPEGRDDNAVRAMCDDYVTAHPDEFAEFAEMAISACVTAVETFRAAGMEEAQWRVEVWLLHRFEPQSIGGEYQAQIRIPRTGE